MPPHLRKILAVGTISFVWALMLLLVVASASPQHPHPTGQPEEFFNHRHFNENTFATNLYNYSTFETPAVTIRNEGTLAQVDSDHNGYIYTLNVNATVDVNVPGNYIVTASFLASNGDVLLQSRDVILLSHNNEHISLSFDVRQLAYTNYTGPITSMFVKIHDSRSQQLVSTNTVELQGLLVDANRLEASPLFLISRYNDTLVDINGDGVPDAIRLAASVYVKAPGEYAICGTLNDKEGNLAEVAAVPLNLKRGTNFFNVIFKKTAIINNGNDGPYFITLRLTDPTGQQVFMRQSSPYETKPYKISDMGQADIYFKGILNDKAEDTNNDEKYDFLTAELNFDVVEPGTYEVIGYLYHGLQFVSLASVNGDFDVGKHTVPLRFEGADIGKTGIKDSFTLRSIEVFDGWGLYTADHVLARKELNYRTANYDAATFSSQPSPAKNQENLNTAIGAKERSTFSLLEEPRVLIAIAVLGLLTTLAVKKMKSHGRSSPVT